MTIVAEKAGKPTTHIPQHAEQPATESRVVTAGVRIGDALSLSGAALASFTLTAFLSSQIAPIRGFLAFFLIAYVLFVGIYALIVSFDETPSVVLDRVVAVLVQSGALLLVFTLGTVLIYTVIRGGHAFMHWNLFTQDMSTTGPLDALSKGGVWNAIYGTFIQISIALAITIPLGITTALFLSEFPSPFTKFVRTIVEAMTALPSVVAGLFILASFILALGFQKSGLAAGLAISVMMLPIMIRASDVVFRLVPNTLKEASLGLGASHFRTVWTVVLPTSRSGLMTAIILATARGVGETSPVLLTAGFTSTINYDPTSGPMPSLPLNIFEFTRNSPTQVMIQRGFGTALVLMSLVLILFIAARWFGAQTVAKKAERKRKRALLVRRVRNLLSTVGQRSSAPTEPVSETVPGSSHV
ncbi:phosphate transport system permease protein PstA [Nocardioides baekrokdamisoli]|uniref:Phosphate transport system permease protein PstA n=1 Tax=Nocardioides baekrokdamisoli TaxID=1804624 RepID=A0A3G9IW91_9ACTN|nr:phosphate ABC transporter permease PstA [Nocardioides baekrokdamisoli]BBH17971.1 phosphate transport system permease protein PstA [Nocardioides baekrokdamisoli]